MFLFLRRFFFYFASSARRGRPWSVFLFLTLPSAERINVRQWLDFINWRSLYNESRHIVANETLILRDRLVEFTSPGIWANERITRSWNARLAKSGVENVENTTHTHICVVPWCSVIFFRALSSWLTQKAQRGDRFSDRSNTAIETPLLTLFDCHIQGILIYIRVNKRCWFDIK